jgi:serine/threonine-protein phosphatase 2A regulatory subunit B
MAVGNSHNVSVTKVTRWTWLKVTLSPLIILTWEADVISTVKFDRTGDFLASGDRAGRVVLFQRSQSRKNCEYRFYTEFQSHEPEFDYLKSLEINEKINKIVWCRRTNDSHFLLTSNG